MNTINKNMRVLIESLDNLLEDDNEEQPTNNIRAVTTWVRRNIIGRGKTVHSGHGWYDMEYPGEESGMYDWNGEILPKAIKAGRYAVEKGLASEATYTPEQWEDDGEYPNPLNSRSEFYIFFYPYKDPKTGEIDPHYRTVIFNNKRHTVSVSM